MFEENHDLSSEFTTVVTRFVAELGAPPIETVVFRVDGYLSADDVISFLTPEQQRYPTEHSIEKRHRFINWGASSDILDYFVSVLMTLPADTMMALAGHRIAKLVRERKLEKWLPDGEKAAEKAMWAVLTAEPHLARTELRVSANGFDRSDRTETVTIVSESETYEVSVRVWQTGHEVVRYTTKKR